MDLDLQHDEFHPAKCRNNFKQIDQNNWHILTNIFYTRVHDEFHTLSFTVTVIIYNSYNYRLANNRASVSFSTSLWSMYKKNWEETLPLLLSASV